MRRPGPDSQAPPNSSFPNQGSSGKTFSQKRTFLQHASRFDPTGEDTFCSRRVSFIRDTAKSEVGRQIKAVFKELEETDWGQKILEIVQSCKIPFHLDLIQVRVPHSQKMNTDQSTFRKCHMFQERF